MIIYHQNNIGGLAGAKVYYGPFTRYAAIYSATPGITSVENNIVLQWNILNEVENNLVAQWNLLNEVSNSSVLQWNILDEVSNSTILQWDISNSVQNSTVLQWRINELLNTLTEARLMHINAPDTIMLIAESNRLMKILKG